ncbi:uncharacterized protein LOC105204504 [Solenopsis invicta]|uniref:uncharacterized protein LOC105204504 n=1 Tax=Solenopsis invicta TaxID=13686 RepID=UPI00059588BD|nr:uncharacterized protein LOC105204504 [Solenopsis invicta]
MGELPDFRVNKTSRPFIHTGVDYVGPLLVRTSKGRGYKSHKSYIAVFICMTTKALHIELVSDYSAATFLAAYQRFIARRGAPSSLYSDNGTTFRGADQELTASYQTTTRDPNFQNYIACEGAKWHFLPPSAPHFGGLWEAAVKSIKYHIKRSIGSHTLTFEELMTLLCRIELFLNSQPIAAASDSIDDYAPITPGHFLIGTSLTASPEASVFDLSEQRLSRWQLIQKLNEEIWRAWRNNYLHTLQQRPKWRSVQQLAKQGRLFLLRDPLAPPSKWKLGRITQCHLGPDHLIRVVTIKTATAEYKRPITKICFLPVDINSCNERDNATAGSLAR